MIQSGGFIGRFLGPLLKAGLPFIKPKVLAATASAANSRINKNFLTSGNVSAPHNTTLIISNDKMKDFIEIVKSLEGYGLLLKTFSEAVENEAKENKVNFLVCYLVHWVQVC